MKNTSLSGLRRTLLVVPCLALAMAGAARAATDTWTTTTGSVTDGSGTWTATSTNFYPGSGSVNVSPKAGDAIVVSSSTGTGGFTITLGQGRDLYYAASTLTFNKSYTLQANSVADGLSIGGITVAGGTSLATGLTVNLNTYLSNNPALTVGSFSTVNVTGGGFIGAVTGATTGVGTVNVNTGVYDAFGTIGSSSNSNMAVNFGTGSSAVEIRSSNLTVGGGQTTGTDSLEVKSGTLVSTITNGSTQALNVGTGIAATAGAGAATLTLDAGGEIDAGGNVLVGAGTVASSNGGNGTVTINGGSFVANGTMAIGATGNVTNALTDTVNITAGVVDFKGLSFGTQTPGSAQNFKTGSTATLNLSGGTLYIGTTGITSTPATTANLTSVINYSGGTLALVGTSTPSFGSVPIVVSGTGGTIQTVGPDGSGFSTILNGPISSSGSVGITKTGTGTLTLAGVNTYTGPTTVNGGNLTEDFTKTAGSSSSSVSNYIASTSGLVLGGSGTFNINGRGNATATPTVAGTAASTSLTAATVVGQNTLALASASGLVVGEGITGTGIPAGTYIVAISTNTVTISSQVTAVLAANVANSITAAPYIGTAGSGQTTFAVVSATGLAAGDVITGGNFAAGTYITSINGTLITVSSFATASAATGATFTAATTGSTSQTFATTTINPGNNALTLNNVGAGTALNLGTLGHNVGGTVNFTQPSGTVSTTNGYTVSNASTGVLGAWATVGSGVNLSYATDTGAGTAITSLTGTAATANLANVTSATGNFAIPSNTNETPTTNLTANTLQSTGTGATTALGSHTLTVNGLMSADSGGTWTISATSGGGIIIGSSSELDITSSATGITISAPIADNGSTPSALVLSNANVVTLSGANTYSGSTFINAGTVNLNVAQVGATSGPLGSGASNSAITFNGGKIVYSASNAFDYSPRIVNSLGAVSLDVNGQTVTYGTGLASSNTGGLTVTSGAIGGKLILSGANAYTGLTTITTGGTSGFTDTVQLSGSGTLGASTNGLLIQGGTAGTTATLDLNGTSQSVGTFNGSTTGVITNSSITPSVLTVGTGNAGVSFTYAGNMTGNLGITKVGGSSTLTLSGPGGASNNYTGTTTVNAGSIAYTGANSFAFSSPIVVNDGGAIFLNATGAAQSTDTQNISIAGYGNQSVIDALNNNTGTNTVAGNITLTDYASIGVGNASQLTIGNSSANTIATNGYNLFIDQSTGTLTINSSITGGGGLLKNGTTPTQLALLNGNNTYTGNTVLQSGGGGSGSGGYRAGSTSAFGVNSALIMWKPSTGTIQQVDLNGFNNSFGSLGGNTSNGFGVISLGGATLTTGGDNSNTSYSGDITSASPLISSTGGGLTKIGTGTQTLGGANAIGFTGTTTVSGGTLASVGIAAPAAQTITSTSGSSTVTVASISAFYVGQGITGLGFAAGTTIIATPSSTTITVSQNAGAGFGTGTGTFFGATQGLGSGPVVMGTTAGTTLDLTGDLGGTTVASLSGGASTGGNIVLGSTPLTINGTGLSNVYNGVISSTGTGGVTMAGTGTQTLGGANTYTGGTIINSGTLVVSGSTVAASAVSINNSGTLGGSGLSNEGTLSGTVTMASGGAINLQDGAIGTLHTGAIAVQGGTLSFDIGAGSTGNLDSIASTGGLTVTGSNTIVIGLVSGTPILTAGTYSLITTSTGTLGSLTGLTFGNSTTTEQLASGSNTYTLNLINGGASGLELQVVNNTGPTSFTLATSAASTLVHAGASTTVTTTLANTGTGAADSIDYSGVGASNSGVGSLSAGTPLAGNLANNNTAVSNTSQTLTTTTGTSGTATISSTGSLTNHTVGGTPSGTPTGTSVTVYSGKMIWTGATNSTWATNTNWNDSLNSAVNAAPGLDASFAGVDTATFGAQAATTATVGLNGAAPNLNAITFSSPDTAYTLAQNVSGGTGTSSITLSGGTPSINVTNPGGSLTAGTQTISAPLILGATTSLNVASSQTLNISGAVSSSGTFGLSNSGPGTTVLSSLTGNTYSGPTTITGGKFYINNTSGSGTGTGAVTVGVNGTANSGTLAGKGIISASTGTVAVTVNGGGTLASGDPSQVSGTGLIPDGSGHQVGGMTLNNAVVTIGSSLGTAKLAFDLGSGTSGINNSTASGPNDFSNPNNNSTYLKLTGSTTINFVGATSIALTDLTNTSGTGSLKLAMGNAYELISAGSNMDYLNLVIASGTGVNTTYSLSQTSGANGYVLGVFTGPGTFNSASINTAGYVTPISIAQYGADGVTPLSAGATYNAPALYLQAGNLEVVPEPGTWALMIGGLALLVVIQRRRNKTS